MNQPVYYRGNRFYYYVHGAKKVVAAGVLAGVVAAAFWAGLAGAASVPATQPQATAAHVAELISKLNSDDPDVRSQAAADLRRLYPAARPALLRASRSDDPGLREQATQVLLAMPWSVTGDPLPVRKLLAAYNSPSPADRCEIVAALSELPDDTGVAAMQRLLTEDPSDEVRWAIVTHLHEMDRGPELAGYRRLEPPMDDAPMLALCGFARLSVGNDSGWELLGRSADVELDNPSGAPEVDEVIHLLADRDCQEHRYEEAAGLRRRELAHGGPIYPDGTPVALLELLALHAQYGPLKGWPQDQPLAVGAAASPVVECELYKIYSRTGELSKSFEALLAARTRPKTQWERDIVAEFLFQHGWNDLAQEQCALLLKMPPEGGNAQQARGLEANAHFLLAAVAAQRGDDYTSAVEKERAMRDVGENQLTMNDKHGHRWSAAASELWADIHWHYLRAAVAKKDDAEIDRQLGALLPLRSPNPDIAMDVTPLLEKRGREQEARQAFDAAEGPLLQAMSDDPGNPEPLNEAAWLCSQCGMDLSRALGWATRAADAAPNDAAILDTLAHVHFRLGHFEQARQIEARAAQIDPDDSFMQAELKKFTAAATQPSSATTRP